MNDLHRKMVANGDYRLVIVASEGELRSLCRALDTCRFHIIEAHHDDPDDEEVDEKRRLLDSLNVLQARMEAKLEKAESLRLKAQREIQADEAFTLYDMGEGKVEKVSDWRWDGDVASCGFAIDRARRLFVVRFAKGKTDVIDQHVMG